MNEENEMVINYETGEPFTEAELVALGDSDIQKWVRRQMAEAGIPLTEEPKKPDLIEITIPTKRFFEVSGIPGWLFDSADDAGKMFALLKTLPAGYKDRDYSDGVDHYLTRDAFFATYSGQTISIQSVDLAEKSDIKATKEFRETNKRLEAQHALEMKEYLANKNSADQIRDRLHSAIYEAEREVESRTRAIANFSEYLELSKGDFDIACTFYAKAYGQPKFDKYRQWFENTVEVSK